MPSQPADIEGTSKPGKPFIVPIFLPHAGCPHRCIFCNQHAVSELPAGPTDLEPERVRGQIDRFLRYKGRGRSAVQVAYFGGNFLGIQKGRLSLLLALAEEYVARGDVDGIRFSTRPDTVDEQRMEILDAYSVDTVELGVQSMNDAVLARSLRGHTAADTEKAFQQLKTRGYEVGLQMMVGLPGENLRRLSETARRICGLKPDFVRIYPTLVLKNSLLAGMYRRKRYTPLSTEECVQRLKALYLVFLKNDIPVVRMGLQASIGFESSGDILAGPYHPSMGHMVHAALFLEMAERLLSMSPAPIREATFIVHRQSVSKLQGLRKANVEKLLLDYNLQNLRLEPRDSFPRDGIALAEGAAMTYRDLTIEVLKE